VSNKTLQSLCTFANSSSKNSAVETEILYHAKVVSVEDPWNCKRIKVRIDGVDNSFRDKELAWCIPFMSSFFHCLPLVGEHVLCFCKNPWNKAFDRFWIGPILTGDNTETETYESSMNELGLTVRNKNKGTSVGRA